MTQPIDSAATDAAVNALFATISRLVELSDGMRLRQGAAGTRLVFTGLPTASLNIVSVGPDADLGEVDAFAKEMSAMGAPWSIQSRGEVDSALLELAARHGRTSSSTLPLLIWDAELLPTVPASVPEGTTVREVRGDEAEVYAAALAAGFGMPKEVADLFSLPALLDAPDMTAFVLDLNGAAVATGFNIITGDQVGLYNGSVPPQHRGNGYYRALVAARLRHAAASGARYAFTQNTPMSRPLYESLGFQLAETWTYLTSAS
ncbi:GNAT family N-acetyltransferase [Streptomyces sp. NBC_01190]|uniref:GNAT family N-acetyltransferase n=1 Tax=Streptomyces sp. NBC_01190 TaxID=2903767 RepID=UPI0038673F79|nr:GNAT family N-acetyltransferase [Streptomyces sp. NBC_01190]